MPLGAILIPESIGEEVDGMDHLPVGLTAIPPLIGAGDELAKNVTYPATGGCPGAVGQVESRVCPIVEFRPLGRRRNQPVNGKVDHSHPVNTHLGSLLAVAAEERRASRGLRARPLIGRTFQDLCWLPDGVGPLAT